MIIHQYNINEDLGFVYEALFDGGFLIDLGCVFALIALPNQNGLEFIDKTKKRLPGKAYGSVVGDSIDFVRKSELDLSSKQLLFEAIKTGIISNFFLRLPWKGGDNGLVLNGTHQGLVLSGEYHDFFSELNTIISASNQCNLISGLSSVICSSANYSGHPDGSITDLNDALIFADENNIDLLIKFKQSPKMKIKGSFPIFSINNRLFRIERGGPGVETVKFNLIQAGFSEAI